MLLLIFVLFILLIVIYVYYKTYESFEIVTNGETFINRNKSPEDVAYVKNCLNIILDDFNKNYNKTYNLNDLTNIQKSFSTEPNKENDTIYNVSVSMHNTNDYLNKPYNIKFSVSDNIIDLININ
jgi:hypothetical protein